MSLDLTKTSVTGTKTGLILMYTPYANNRRFPGDTPPSSVDKIPTKLIPLGHSHEDIQTFL